MINFTGKKFDINKNWGKCCICLEEVNSKNSFYWLDKKNYKLIGNYNSMSDEQKTAIDNDKENIYIALPQYVNDSRYKELVVELNNSKVTVFFNEAKNEDDAQYRYRCFVDWNGLNFSEWYKNYLKVSKILIDWCKENAINYKHKQESPPKNYIYDGRDLSKINWVFLTEEL